MTPERKEEIRASATAYVHPKFSKFDSSRKVILELLDGLDALENELSDTSLIYRKTIDTLCAELAATKDDSLIYQKYQVTQNRLKTVLKAEIKNETVKKVFFGGKLRFKNKPVMVEAIKYLGPTSYDEMCEAWADKGFKEFVSFDANNIFPLEIKTVDGELYCPIGDWIVRGVDGAFSSCNADEFEKSFEPW